MKLTRYSDYALRICLYLALNQDRLVSISEIAETYGIPRGNTMKLATDLVSVGILVSVRGRSGGLRLSGAAHSITVGQIVRHTEDHSAMVDCSSCILAPDCGLICVLKEAQVAFFQVLDSYSLQKVCDRSPEAFLQKLFQKAD